MARDSQGNDVVNLAARDSNDYPIVSQGTKLAGEDIPNDVMKVEDRSSYTNLTASGLIKTGSGRLKGFFVASTTSGTIKLWDNTSAATTTIINTFTPSAGFYPLPDIEFSTGCFATLANTIDVTFFWK
jgi:hypothetical protein